MNRMTRNVVGAVAVAAALAALAARAIASAFESIERELGTYRVEVPSEVPVWMDEYL